MTGEEWSESYSIADFDDGGGGHEARTVGGLRELEKARKRFLPKASRREHNSATS